MQREHAATQSRQTKPGDNLMTTCKMNKEMHDPMHAPMRRPDGAVKPAMNPTTGFLFLPWCTSIAGVQKKQQHKKARSQNIAGKTKEQALANLVVLGQELGSSLLRGTTNLTDHDDACARRMR